jgi:predicted transcriptional regulator
MLLGRLFENGPMNERQLEAAAGDVDQLNAQAITEWAADAAERGLIEQTGGTYWNITDAGRRRIGDDPGC